MHHGWGIIGISDNFRVLGIYPSIWTDPVSKVKLDNWVLRMGFDINSVCVPGWIVADDTKYTVSAELYRRDEKTGEILLSKSKTDVLRYVYTIQLESPAPPFPRAI